MIQLADGLELTTGGGRRNFSSVNINTTGALGDHFKCKYQHYK